MVGGLRDHFLRGVGKLTSNIVSPSGHIFLSSHLFLVNMFVFVILLGLKSMLELGMEKENVTTRNNTFGRCHIMR